MILSLIKKHYVILIFTIVGFLGGFLYWKFIGCSNGTCPLKSSSSIMTLYGGLLGGTLGSVIDGFTRGRKKG